MNILFRLFRIFMVASLALFAAGCTTEELEGGQTDPGNVQFRLLKKAESKATELDYLHDARKIMVTLRSGNQNVNLPLKIAAHDDVSAEFGVRTEIGQLYPGHYSVLNYRIYDNLDEELLSEEPSEAVEFDVETGGLASVNLYISVTPRGRLEITLVKDLSEFKDIDTGDGVQTKGDEKIDFPFSGIAKADVVIKDSRTNVEKEFKGLKLAFTSDAMEGTSELVCDSLVYVEAGTYYLSSVHLYNSIDEYLAYLDYYKPTDVVYTVEDNKTTQADVPVRIDATADHIKDYINLKRIWDALDGPNWKWRPGTGTNPDNCNWNFDKDIDLWGQQPGVGLYANGRVSSLNIGPFDPHGDMPEALGELSELNTIYLGTNNDVQYEGMVPEYPTDGWVPAGDGEGGNLGMKQDLDPWAYFDVTSNVAEARLKYARKLLQSRHPANNSEFEKFTGYARGDATVYATYPHGFLANHITSLPENFGKLKKLEKLYIANTAISELPASFAELESLTDLQIYNCPAMEKFPTVIAELPNLIMLDVSNNRQWESEDLKQGLEAVFGGKSNAKIQILYSQSNTLESFPEKNLDQMGALGLIDFSNCGLKEMKVGFGSKVRLVEVYLDNNELTSIPDDFTDVRDLTTLSCSENKLTVFPSFFPEPNEDNSYLLEEINLSANKITDDSFQSFKGVNVSTLNLSNNKLTHFPTIFAKTGCLFGMLNLSYNQIDDFPKEAFVGLKQVQGLDLSMNWITEVDKDFNLAEDAPYLQQVDLSKNRFTAFPVNMFNGFSIYTFWFGEQMDAEGNKCFSTWPDGIESYTWLKNLKVNGNDIGVVKEFPAELYSLDVSGNPNIVMEIPAGACADITGGTYVFTYDLDQTGITGCDALGIERD